MKKRTLVVAILLGLMCFAVGRNIYAGFVMKKRQMPMPSVSLTQVQETEIIDKAEAVGRVASKYSVGLRARLQGYLQKRYFEEGSYVNKGDLLFIIEPDQYEISVKQAKASVEDAKAALTEAEKNYIRMSELLERGCISKSAHDSALATRDRAKAAVDMQMALLDNAKLNLSYTKIYAPVSGRISDLTITEGNYISATTGNLANIVSVDPIYVTFSLSSKDFLKLQQNKQDFKNRKIEIELPDGTTYQHKGIEDFYNNSIDQLTGTIKVRATFANPNMLLLPGQFVTVNIYSNIPVKKLIVPQEAVMENPAGKYVYILDKENTVKAKPIETAGAYNDFWIIENGLEKDESVIMKGLQKIRPEIKVNVIAENQEGNKDVQ
ncbi:MAG: efflux RND transporter periplasmic adaptor subunit [Candidatus Gastranaerophilales bacterium]|nr:efflux RND transporter periplasmic adaptor subunit [Candidatus Gastranaerophilales bacterium]